MEFRGIVPAIVTPFAPDGGVNTEVLRNLVAYQMEKGCQGFFVCGSAGEGVLMTRAERSRAVEAVVSEVSGQVPVMVHVGAISTSEAVELAAHARKAGASAVSSIPPLYYKLPWPAIIGHIRAIAEAAQLPTYYYHIPYITGIIPSAAEFAEMSERVENLAGFKFSSEDLFLMWQVLEATGGRQTVLFGVDQQLISGLVMGAHGGIGSTYNFMTGWFVQIYQAYLRGDIPAAKQVQDRVNRAIQLFFKYGANRGTEKMMTSMLGFEIGPPRLPTPPFPAERVEALRKDMEAIGLLDG
ncbi:MAG: dihydrodipicolinate synthase family protein [Candidatus Hydrogenedentes bacterium]|nr:dihydrodipicolinate synthase family protein [Candidatus Hydrogenedentota bacterium]